MHSSEDDRGRVRRWNRGVDRKDVVLYGSDLGERYVGGAAVTCTFSFTSS